MADHGVVGLDPGTERSDGHDVGLVGEVEHDPAAEGVPDEDDRHPGMGIADDVERPARVGEGRLVVTVPAKEAVLESDDGGITAGREDEIGREEGHPQHRTHRPPHSQGSARGAPVDDQDGPGGAVGLVALEFRPGDRDHALRRRYGGSSGNCDSPSGRAGPDSGSRMPLSHKGFRQGSTGE